MHERPSTWTMAGDHLDTELMRFLEAHAMRAAKSRPGNVFASAQLTDGSGTVAERTLAECEAQARGRILQAAWEIARRNRKVADQSTTLRVAMTGVDASDQLHYALDISGPDEVEVEGLHKVLNAEGLRFQVSRKSQTERKPVEEPTRLGRAWAFVNMGLPSQVVGGIVVLVVASGFAYLVSKLF